MVAMAGFNLPDKAVRADARHQRRRADRPTERWSRRVVNISEITGMEGAVITMQDLFLFERHGFDQERKVRGNYRPTGIRPKFSERLLGYGIELAPEMFEPEAPDRPSGRREGWR
jgi:pilus assembly protein CpaF